MTHHLTRELAILMAKRLRKSLQSAEYVGENLYWGERRVVGFRVRKVTGRWAAAGAYQVDCRLMGCGGQVEWREITPEQAVDGSSGVLRMAR